MNSWIRKAEYVKMGVIDLLSVIIKGFPVLKTQYPEVGAVASKNSHYFCIGHLDINHFQLFEMVQNILHHPGWCWFFCISHSHSNTLMSS